MRRGLAVVLACSCAVLAGLLAARPTSDEPKLWIVFDGMSMAPNDELVGHFRLLSDPQQFTEDPRWSRAPHLQIQLGDRLAAGYPWILAGFERVRRKLYYEIQAVRIPQLSSTKPRELKLVSKETEVDCAIIRHRVLGQEIRITAVQRFVRPADERRVIYPDPSLLGSLTGRPRLLTWPFDEERSPPEPVRHEPDTGPLVGLDPGIVVTTPYFELPDGRLVWWDALNARLVVRSR